MVLALERRIQELEEIVKESNKAHWEQWEIRQQLEAERDALRADRDNWKMLHNAVWAELEQLREELRMAQDYEDFRQMRVQLVGCLTVAEGHGLDDPAKQGDYGWSLAYQKVLELRLSRDAALVDLDSALTENARLLVENERLRAQRDANHDVAHYWETLFDGTRVLIRKAKQWRDAIVAVRGEPQRDDTAALELFEVINTLEVDDD